MEKLKFHNRHPYADGAAVAGAGAAADGAAAGGPKALPRAFFASLPKALPFLRAP